MDERVYRCGVYKPQCVLKSLEKLKTYCSSDSLLKIRGLVQPVTVHLKSDLAFERSSFSVAMGL